MSFYLVDLINSFIFEELKMEDKVEVLLHYKL